MHERSLLIVVVVVVWVMEPSSLSLGSDGPLGCSVGAYTIVYHHEEDAHAADGAEPLFRPRQRSRSHQEVLLRRARVRGDAAPELPVPGVLARDQRQDPGAHGAGRD